MSLDLSPDGPARTSTLDTHTAPPLPSGPASELPALTRGAVERVYGPDNTALADARIEEVSHFEAARAVALVRDAPGTFAPVRGDAAFAPVLADALQARYQVENPVNPDARAAEITRGGVTYAVQGLDRVRDAAGATHLVGQSNEPAVAYLDREQGFPYTFHVRAFHPDAQFGGYFSGDSRSYTTALDVTSRVEQTVTLDTSTDRITTSDRSDPSHHPVLGTKTANPDGGVRDYQVANASADRETHTFGTWVQGANPLTPAFATPNIDVDGRFTVTEDLARGELRVQAQFTGDNFPNTEAFVTDRAGTSVFIATGSLSGSPLSLVGENADRAIMNADLTIRLDPQGRFTGVTAGGRAYTVAEWNQRAAETPQ